MIIWLKHVLNNYPKIAPASDCTILVELGHKISEYTHKKIFTLITHLIRNPIHGVVNIHPGYSSMLLTLDKMANIDYTIRLVENIFDVVQNSEPPEEKLVEDPVLYGGNYGKDIQRVVQFSKLSEGEIIQRHQT